MASASKPWGGPGAWALDAELAEAEEIAAASVASVPTESFPTLKETASAAKPKKKKKGTTLSLSEFTTGVHVGAGSRGVTTKGLTTDELLHLPTGPKERTQEELERSRPGGGFRSYGSYGDRGDGPGRRGDGDGSLGQAGERRGTSQSRGSDFEQMPSRADEVDNWTSVKKPLSGFSQADSGRRERYGDLGRGGGPSRADEADRWSMEKRQAPSARYSGIVSEFRENSSPMDSDRWTRGGTGGSFPNNGERQRPRIVLDPPKRDMEVTVSDQARTRPNPFGAARPREEVLAEKGLDWRKVEADMETKSSHSSRPSSAHSNRASSSVSLSTTVEVAPKLRQRVNPFGDAKPREVLLEEKGKDWRKIDMELEQRRVARHETEDEKSLKEEMNPIEKKLSRDPEANNNGESTQHSAEELASLNEQIVPREKNLELLTQNLDNKVKFEQMDISETPGSGAGRVTTFVGRAPSQSYVEESRSIDLTDRPSSHENMGDTWSHPCGDRRGFHRGKGEGFLGNRKADRSMSRERW